MVQLTLMYSVYARAHMSSIEKKELITHQRVCVIIINYDVLYIYATRIKYAIY